MLMIIALLIQGIIAAPAATIDRAPKSAIIVQTVCNDALDTHSNLVETYDSNHNMLQQLLDVCNNDKSTPYGQPCDIRPGTDTIELVNSPWIEHGGLIFGACDWQGEPMKVWYKDGDKEKEKTFYASCQTYPFDCMLDPANPTTGEKKEIRLY